jgi:hypothetical protein
MKVKYKLKEIHPKVFLVTIDNSYDLAMTFCRVQEFYESPYKEIRGKVFNMIEFQRLYSIKRNENFFSYPIDWSGFNIPSNVIEDFFDKFNFNFDKHDYNLYDQTFEDIHSEIISKSEFNECGKYYIIASEPDNKDTINHELSHAFYYLYPEYKKEADKIINKIPEPIYNKLKNTLFDLGYNSKVIKDEIQAYLANDYDTITQDINLNKKNKIIIDKVKEELKVLSNKMH